MSDWQPVVTRILKVERHPDADLLDIATVWDYPIVCKRNEYAVGDLVSYLPIDTIVPDVENFYFLCPQEVEKYEENNEIKTRTLGPKFPLGLVPEKYRQIKSKKIRGIYSQGMLMKAPEGLNEGDSVVELLNLKKFIEEEDNVTSNKTNGNNKSVKKTNGNNEMSPKGWAIPYYDIDGARKYLNCIQNNEEIVLTEKLHGSNAAFCYDGEKLWVKSRNFYKRLSEQDMWWDIALRYDLENKLKAFPRKVFFGEIIGQVSKFRYDAKIEKGALMSTIHFFDVWDIDSARYLDYDDRVQAIKSVGLSPVPELYRGLWLGKELMYSYAEGKSTLNQSHLREGWVLNTVKERYEHKLKSRMQVKLVGEGYNLAK